MSGAGRSAARHYDQAIDHLLHFRMEVEDEVGAALAEAPDFPMGNVLGAYLGLLTTEAEGGAPGQAELRRLPRQDRPLPPAAPRAGACGSGAGAARR